MLAMIEQELISVCCPFQKKAKNGYLYTCNRICVKVEPGARGEAHCISCKLNFNFTVDSQSNYKPYVKVQHEDTK